MSAYSHLAELIDRILVSFIRAKEEDIHVEPIGPGFFANEPGGVLIIDRHPFGLGIANAIDTEMCGQLVRWAHHIITHCPISCVSGCANCAPDRLFDPQARWAPDKVHARMLLGR